MQRAMHAILMRWGKCKQVGSAPNLHRQDLPRHHRAIEPRPRRPRREANVRSHLLTLSCLLSDELSDPYRHSSTGASSSTQEATALVVIIRMKFRVLGFQSVPQPAIFW